MAGRGQRIVAIHPLQAKRNGYPPARRSSGAILPPLVSRGPPRPSSAQPSLPFATRGLFPPWHPVTGSVGDRATSPEDRGLRPGRLTISAARTNVVLLIRRTVRPTEVRRFRKAETDQGTVFSPRYTASGGRDGREGCHHGGQLPVWRPLPVPPRRSGALLVRRGGQQYRTHSHDL